MEGIIRMYENYLQKINPGIKNITYDIKNLFNYVDRLPECAAMVKDKGVLEPILVRALDDASDNYEIIAGERRWRAAKAAGLHQVPVVVKQMDDREALEVALIENLHRSDLSPLEEAEAYSRLLEEFGHTQEQLAILENYIK